MKYLTLINAIALLHQYQRPVKCRGTLRYIEATVEDIKTANTLAHEILGRSLDELPPQSRRLLLMLDAMVCEACGSKMHRADYRFTRKEVRRFTNWTDFQVQTHLVRLVALEYVLVHRGSRGQMFVYELLYDGKGEDGAMHLPGLIEPEEIGKLTSTTKSSRGADREFEGSFSPHIAHFEGAYSMAAVP